MQLFFAIINVCCYTEIQPANNQEKIMLSEIKSGIVLGTYRFPKYPMFAYQAKTTASGVNLTCWMQTIRLTNFEFDGLLCIGLLDRA